MGLWERAYPEDGNIIVIVIVVVIRHVEWKLSVQANGDAIRYYNIICRKLFSGLG